MEESEIVYDACIVGMGIGGLAVAVALQQVGLSVFITEKDQLLSDRKQGYGLTLTNSISGPLAKLGLLDQCIEKNCPSHSHFTFGPDGEILGYYGRAITNAIKKNDITPSPSIEVADSKEFGGSRGNLRIPRQELRQMMLKLLSKSAMHWGFRFIDFCEDSTDFITTTFEVARSEENSTATESVVKVKSRILIGADGIRSPVRQRRDQLLSFQGHSPLRYVGTSVILGISQIDHPLLRNKGYYVLDGVHRLFTMPFLTTSDEADSEEKCDVSGRVGRQIMWQLSFSDITEAEGMALRSSSFLNIQHVALQKTSKWFSAVHALINATMPGEIWATPLYDRDAMAVLRGPEQHQKRLGRVTVLGDACHPMSMFKGQGANQALEDAVLLASKIKQRLESAQERPQKRRKLQTPGSSDPTADNSMAEPISLVTLSAEQISSLLRTFEREMIGRADKKVQASRHAAQYLHSEQALKENFGIHGIDNDHLDETLALLKAHNVNASMGDELERLMRDTIVEARQSSA